MLVKAKCVTPAWDSTSTVMYVPGGGPLPEGLYEIDRDGPLASLKMGSTYVFDFDRNANPDDKPHDYSCKRCGKKFKTLAELGRHSNAEHKAEEVKASDEEVVVVVDGRGRKKGRTFTCKVEGCGVTLPNLYAVRVHKKIHEEGAVIKAA